MSDLKRFENWEEVDCNDCSHYRDSTCDGATKGSRIGCNSYLATRKVVIPEKLNKLERDVMRVGKYLFVLFVINFILLFVHILGAI